MGLDMFLYARRKNAPAAPETYVEWSEWKEENLPELGYWRKANAIHEWFTQNCADGEDECQEVEVTLEQLHGLRVATQQCLGEPDLAPTLLPTRSGFFFGDTGYDEYYFEGLRSTLDILRTVEKFFIDPQNMRSFVLVYQASW